MKKLLFPLLASTAVFAPQIASATLLVGFYDFDGNSNPEAADYAISGFTGTVSKDGVGSIDLRGSTNGSYGGQTFEAPAVNPAVNDGYLKVINSDLTFTIFNNTGNDSPLTSLLFDAASPSGSAQFTVSYSIGGGAFQTLTPTPLTANVVSGPANSSTSYGAYLLDLTGLTLSALSSADFVFSAGPEVRIDNVAFSAIPEPGSLMALGCVLGSGLLLRSRSRRTQAFGAIPA